MSAALCVLISAMGGEGGGVLAGWITAAATACDLPVQRTSIPGVAQRTGATTYYMEISPLPWARHAGRQPVLALSPAEGNVDLVVATELLEASRAVQRGFVTPQRTTLIGSTHRVYTISEKMALGDGRLASQTSIDVVTTFAKRGLLLDMEQIARRHGSHINAVILGAIAASAILPIPDDAYRAAIQADGRAVAANLRGFDAGREAALGNHAGRSETARPDKPACVTDESSLWKHAQNILPGPAHALAKAGITRLIEYQDARYAAKYLDQLRPVAALDGDDGALSREAARHLALWMSCEDIPRVAQLKLRRGRLEHIRAEVQAKPGELMVVADFMKPGLLEFCSVLPAGLAKSLLALARRWNLEHKLALPIRLKSSTVTGVICLRLLASLRRFRPFSYGHQQEDTHIAAWLRLVLSAAALDRQFAAEVIQCAGLVKGYGSTRERGLHSFSRICRELIEPALSQPQNYGTLAQRISQARKAALSDDSGTSLSKTLAGFTAMTTSREATTGVG